MWRLKTTVGPAAFLAALLLAGPALAQDAKPETEAGLQFEFAEKLFQIKVYKTAAAEYGRFLKDYPKSAHREEARYKLAMCHAKLGGAADSKKALAELATLRKEFPNGKRFQDALFRAGHIRYLLGDIKGAVSELGQLEKLTVRADLAMQMHHFLGRAYSDLGQFPQALKHLATVAKAPKETKLRPYALIVLADLHLRMKNLDQNAAVLDTLLRDYPKLETADEMLVKLGHARLAVKQFDKALAAYKKTAGDGVYRDIAAVGQARALLGLKKYDAAISVCTVVLARFKETPETRGKMLPGQCFYITGLAHFNKGEYEPAAIAFASLLEKVQQGPMAEDGAYKLCWSYYRQGPQLARKLVSSCVTFRRSFPTSKWAGQIVFLTAEGHISLNSLKDYAIAVILLKQIGPKDANYAAALYRIAYCHHKQNKLTDAARAYDLFARRFGKHRKTAAALAGAAGLYQAAGKFKHAAERYARYLAVAPKGPEAEEALYQRGICFAKMSQFDKMTSIFHAYAKQYPKGKWAPEASWWIGRHHRIRADASTEKGDDVPAAKDYAVAIGAFRASAALGGPGRDRALLTLAECFYSLGKNEERRAEAASVKAKDAADAQKAKLEKEAADLEKLAAASFQQAARGFLDVMSRQPNMLKDEPVYLWAGTFFRDHGETKPAISVFKAYLARFKKPKQADAALHQLARLHGELVPPDHKAVIVYSDQLLKSHGKSALVLQTKSAKAEALYHLRKYPAAEKLYLEVSQQGTAALKVDAILKLGHIGFARKEYAAAARYFARIGLLYDDAEFASEALYFAGKANFLLKDADEGVRFWQKLLSRYAKSASAAKARAELPKLGYIIGPKGTIKKN